MLEMIALSLGPFLLCVFGMDRPIVFLIFLLYVICMDLIKQQEWNFYDLKSYFT